MSVSKQWPGGGTNTSPASYSIPESGELNWQALSSFLQALGDSAQATTFQKWAILKATTTPVAVSATTDCVVACQLGVAGAVTVNLPAGANKQTFIIYDATGDAATNNITINRNGTDTIRGATSLVINQNYGAVVLTYNAGDTDWKVLGPVAPLDSDLIAIGNLSTNGLIARTGSGTAATRTITAASSKVAVTNGDGVSGNPTVDVTESNLTLDNIGGTLGVAKGGTGLTGGTSGGVPYYSGAAAITSSGVLASNGVVLGGGAGASPTTTAAGAANQVLRVPGGGGAPAFGAVDLAQASAVTGTLPVGNGGTGQTTQTAAFNALDPLTTKGDIIGHNGTDSVRLGVGANGTVLTADSGESTGLKWASSATVPAEGYVYSNGTSLATVGDFAGDANKVAGINSAATAPEYKSLLAGTLGSDFAVAHAAGSITYNLPDAGVGSRGVITAGPQILQGLKTFNDGIKLDDDANVTTLNYYEKTTHDTTFLGNSSGNSSGTKTIKVSKIGGTVNLTIPATTATTTVGDTKLVSQTALATRFRPAADLWMPCGINIGGNAQNTPGACRIMTTGIIEIYKDFAQTGAYSAATCGLYGEFSVSYEI